MNNKEQGVVIFRFAQGSSLIRSLRASRSVPLACLPPLDAIHGAFMVG